MKPDIRTDYHRRHYYFDRRCEGYYPEPEAKPIDKIIAIIGLIGLFSWALWEYFK